MSHSLLSSLTIHENATEGAPQISYNPPALRLPYELLQDIFRLAFPRKRIHDAPQPTQYLLCGHICSHWRNALHSNPYMWSSISLPKYPQGLIRQCLLYSNDRPLEVYIRGNGFHSILEEILSHIERIGSLFVEDRTETDFVNYLSHPAPCLEILGILETSPDHSPIGISLHHKTCNVKYVHLRGRAIILSNYILHNLLHLKLQKVRGIPSLDKLLDILELSPHLESFTFEYGPKNRLSGSFAELPMERCIRLSSLSHIELQAPACILQAFLGHTVIPMETKWMFRCSEIEIMTNPIFLSFRTHHTSGVEVGLRLIVAGAVLSASLYDYKENVEERTGELSIHTSPSNIFLLFSKLRDLGVISRITALELNYAGTSSAKRFYETVLWPLPNIQQLIFVANVRSTSAQIVRFLCDVLSKPGTISETFPCPLMKNLTIYSRFQTTTAFDALLSCLRYRYAQCPLESLRIIDDTFQITRVDKESLWYYVPEVRLINQNHD